MKKVVTKVTELAEPVVKALDCELWDVEYVKEVGGWFLRVYIDRQDGVSIQNCEDVSRALDPILDEHEDLFPEGYTFEVSSAGAERPLRRESDFMRFIGHLVEIKLYKSKDGRKEYIGNLKSYDNGDITVDAAGTDYVFTKGEVANVRLRIG